MNFGEKVRHLAEQRGVNPATILKELGINHGAVTDWVKKNQIPNGENIRKIAQYFNVTTDYLLGLTDEPTPPPKTLTEQDKLNTEISKLSPEGRKRAEQYVEFLKTQKECSQELAAEFDTFGRKPLQEF